MVAFAVVLVSIALIGGLAACRTQSVGSDAVSVVKRYLEAEKNNDYEAWKSTLWRADTDEQNSTPVFEKPSDMGVISLTVHKVEVSDGVTQRTREEYAGSDLARRYGWSDEYIAENMIVVYAEYTVDYDNTKVPYDEGTLTRVFTLIRDDPDSPWLIWDSAVRPLDSF